MPKNQLYQLNFLGAVNFAAEVTQRPQDLNKLFLRFFTILHPAANERIHKSICHGNLSSTRVIITYETKQSVSKLRGEVSFILWPFFR